MVKKSTLIIGSVLFLVTGVGVYGALFILAPNHVPASSSTERSAHPQDETTSSSDTSGDDKRNAMRRDSSVKNAMAAFAAGMTSYAANNRGSIVRAESQLSSFVVSYLADTNLTDPVTGTPYQISMSASGEGIIHYQPGYTCSEDGLSIASGSSRQFALVTILSSGASYCIES